MRDFKIEYVSSNQVLSTFQIFEIAENITKIYLRKSSILTML